MKPVARDAAGVTQRQRRVAEELRHALAFVLQRDGLLTPAGDVVSITVSEVRVSPDLKNATAYVMPLAGRDSAEILKALKLEAAGLRYAMARQLALKHIPALRFALDTTFDQARRIEELLHQPQVARDLEAVK